MMERKTVSPARRVLAVLLSLLLVLSAAPLSFTVSAESYSGECGAQSGTVFWSLDTDTGVLAITGSGVIQYATGAGSWADHRSGIRTVTVGSGITEICDSAFANCDNLTSVTLPDTLTYVGSSLFQNCTSLTAIEIPGGLAHIGYRMFDGCTALETVTIPSTVTAIAGMAFYGCASLETVTIPSGMTEFADFAFYGCTGLKRIVVPTSVTTFGENVFSGCSALESVEIPGMRAVPKDTFFGCSSLTSVSLSNRLTSIGEDAFAYCSLLSAAPLPATLTEIGDGAFRYSGITSAVIPSDVRTIPSSLFTECRQLTSVSLPDTIRTLPDSLFWRCTSLTDVHLPTRLTAISRYMFAYCSGLANLTIPDSVTSIGEMAFRNCTSLNNLVLPNTLTKINTGAFHSCTSLTHLEIPNSVTDLSGSCSNCTALAAVTLPQTCTQVPEGMFEGCSSLSSITLPNSVTSIGNFAFKDCTGFASFDLTRITELGNGAFYGCTGLTEIVIPNGITCIGAQTFRSCTNLTDVTLPDSVTEISDEAFQACPFTHLTLPANLATIGHDVFRDCTALTEITIPASLTRIEQSAFQGCTSLADVTLQEGLEYICDSAFSGCTSLRSIIIPASVKALWGGFQNCTALEYIHIPDDNWTTIYNDILDGTTAYVCSDSAEGAVKRFADRNNIEFRLCCTHGDTVLHTYAAEIAAPTCTEAGYTTYICSRCGDTYTADETPALGHAWSAWTVTTAATPESTGTETRACTRCAAVETRGIPVIPAGYGFFSGGYGTESSPFLIANAADFDHIDDFYAAYGDCLPSDPVYFTQTANITFSGPADGSAGYTAFTGTYLPTYARATPAAVLDHAVYDGGGHSIKVRCVLLDGAYTGVFGLVTDSAIRNVHVYFVNTDDGMNGMLGTTVENGSMGFIARAENSRLERIEVLYYYDTFEYVGEASVNQAPLAGSAANCFVSDCLAWSYDGCGSPASGFIGGTDSTFVSHNTWAMHSARNVTGTASVWEWSCPEVDMVMQADGQMRFAHIDSDMVTLIDGNGNIIPRNGSRWYTPVYDPDSVGNRFLFCEAAARADIAAGAHGTLQGEGSYGLRINRTGGYCEITGLRPIADAGYTFAGWTNGTNGLFVQQADGSYTYRIKLDADLTGFTQINYVLQASVTADFEPAPPAVLTVHAPTDTVYTGDTIQVTVDLTQNPGLIGMSLGLVYDADALTLTGAEKAGMFTSGDFASGGDLAAQPYGVVWFDALAPEDHTETGCILVFTFTVNDTAQPGEIAFGLTYDENSTFNFANQNVPLTITGTSVTVVRHLPGDGNGDGEIDLSDVTMLVRYLAGGWPDTAVDERNADVDADGIVTLKDAVLLRRYLAGWDVELA